MKTSQLFTFLLLTGTATPSVAAAPAVKNIAQLTIAVALAVPAASITVRAYQLYGTTEHPVKKAAQEFQELAPEMIKDGYASAKPYVDVFSSLLPRTDWRPTPDSVQGGFTE